MQPLRISGSPRAIGEVGDERARGDQAPHQILGSKDAMCQLYLHAQIMFGDLQNRRHWTCQTILTAGMLQLTDHSSVRQLPATQLLDRASMSFTHGALRE